MRFDENKNSNGSSRESTDMNAAQKACTPAESLNQALREMNEMRQGLRPKQSWDEFLRELEEEEE